MTDPPWVSHTMPGDIKSLVHSLVKVGDSLSLFVLCITVGGALGWPVALPSTRILGNPRAPEAVTWVCLVWQWDCEWEI